MKQPIYIALTSVVLLMLTSCSRTLDDIAKWEATGNHLKLIEALEDSDPSIGIAAAEALGNLQTPEAILPLAACLNQTNEASYHDCCSSPCQFRESRCNHPLNRRSTPRTTAAQSIAIAALGKMKATGAIPTLGELLPSADAQQKIRNHHRIRKDRIPRRRTLFNRSNQ